MKKYIVPITLSLVVGFLSAKFMFNQYNYQTNIKTVFKKNTKIYLIQQGVYSSLDAMKESMKSFNYYTYVFDNDKYYTYVGITKSDSNLDKIKGYYKNLGYDIYVKEQSIDNESFTKVLDQYDLLLEQSNDDNLIGAIMAQVLTEYEKRS